MLGYKHSNYQKIKKITDIILKKIKLLQLLTSNHNNKLDFKILKKKLFNIYNVNKVSFKLTKPIN